MDDKRVVDYNPPPEAIPAGLPVPRLQLRWLKDASEDQFFDKATSIICHYELVMPLREHDCRNDEKKNYFVVRLSSTRSSGKSDWSNVGREAPFRDGAHAMWDAELLGNLPIYVIAPDGRFASIFRWNEDPHHG